ncbi:lamin tail domain-containing protein [Verrucomicrobiales bacterium]|jgi:hypothetical protein|nr:lamin tail domain-containing protein [Verrucomicrobiales bacterium]
MRQTFALALLLVLAISSRAQVVINEIHYDPEPKQEFVEFIELFNAGEESADLSGWQFTRGIAYTFADGATLEAGAYLILTESTTAYNKKFGSIFVGGARAFDQWESGSLSNQGDTITLRDAMGIQVDEVDYRVGFPWPVAPNDERGVSMELINPALENELGSSWRPALSKPTPGDPNSVFAENASPNIRQVNHEPQVAITGEAVVVTAKITDDDGMGSVNLLYQMVKPGTYVPLTDDAYETTWTALEMTPMAEDPDFYTVTIPAEVQQHRHLVRYRITFEDALGNGERAPFADDPTPNFAYFCYDGVPTWTGTAVPGETSAKVFGPDVLESLPTYHLISREEDVLDCQYNSSHNNKIYRFLGTLVYDGVVYDHMRYRIRGHGSTYNTGKNKWKWRFNRGNLFQGRDNFGRKYAEPVRTLNISAMATAWNPANRGICGLDEALAFRLWQMVGVPAVNTNYFHFRVIDDATETDANDQYEGDLWGPYLAIEQFDGRALRARGLPDGNIYNMHFANSNYLNEGKGQVDDRSDLAAFTGGSGYNKSNPIQEVSWWRENVQLDWYYSYRSIWEVVNHSDQRDQENSNYYHNPETGKWSIHPWDVDLLYEEFDRWGPDAVQTRVAFEQFRKCLAHDELNAEFQSRARELQDLLLNDDQLWYVIDEMASFVGSRTSGGDTLAITALDRDGVRTVATTASAHGFTEGQTVYIKGAQPFAFSGEKVIDLIPSPTEFAFKGSIFAPQPEPPGPDTVVSTTPDGGGWWEIDQARWDRHPRSRAVEGPSTRTGSFYVNPFRYTRFSGKVRELTSPDFPGMVDWVKRFTVPGGFGGDQLQVLADGGSKEPDKPAITYTGPDNFPIDALTFVSSEFSGGTLFVSQEFAGMQWRLGEISNPSTPGYEPGKPMIFEIDPVWESGELADFQSEIILPAEVIDPDSTYRVRVRLKNQLGQWSHWSDAIEFRATADISPYEGLVISEVMYHPLDVTENEAAQDFEESDFEYIELWNSGNTIIDLANLRFTKGINFDLKDLENTALGVGDRLILTRNAAAFALRYGNDISAGRSWGPDRLSNSGERLKLSLGGGAPVIDFSYGDDEPWPSAADGKGHALEFTGEGDPSDLTGWTASRLGGSPGEAGNESRPETLTWVKTSIAETEILLEWQSSIGKRYQVETSITLLNWQTAGETTEAFSETTSVTFTIPEAQRGKRFYLRVAETE